MAGALTVDTLNSSTGVLATQNGMSGVAKAWVNFNGTTNTIRSSFNVTSITKNSTGNYTIIFTISMPTANYTVIGMCQYQNNAGQTILEGPSDASTSSFKVLSKGNNNAAFDSDFINVSVFSS
jgi:hypothetical protein